MRTKKVLGEGVTRCETCGSRVREVWTSEVPDTGDRKLYPLPPDPALLAERDRLRARVEELSAALRETRGVAAAAKNARELDVATAMFRHIENIARAALSQPEGSTGGRTWDDLTKMYLDEGSTEEGPPSREEFFRQAENGMP